jgi:creatinine amidohydrolase/Fe(II)-dependent formamide hydrolase-like protein
MMWIRPDLVREDRLADNPFGELRVPMLARATYVRPWHLYVPVSAGGETRKSTADKGQAVIEAAASGLADLLVELSEAPWDERFPYA